MVDHEAIQLGDTKDFMLPLTRNEALYIDDSLSMLIEKEFEDGRLGTIRPLTATAGLPAPVDLIDRIGQAILFTTDPDNEGELALVPVSDTDLYIIREVSHSYIKVGDEPVGFNLKKKVYKLLHEEAYEKEKVMKRMLDELDIPIVFTDESNTNTELQFDKNISDDDLTNRLA